jgi:phage repressor protein C with HTH and peptisase S24 domain
MIRMKNGSRIRQAREALGWTQAELAQKAGTTQQTIDRLESGQTQLSRATPAILQALGLETVQSNTPDIKLEPAKLVSGEQLVGERDLPVYSAAEGGDGALILSTDPIEWVKRPAPLANVRGGYGIYIVGDSMEPRFNPGEVALVHPHMPYRSGNDVVLYKGDVHDHHAIVKRLRKATATDWHLTQFNPAEGESRDFTLPREEWSVCHVIVGLYSSR